MESQIRLKGDRQIHFLKKKHSSYNIYLNKDKYIYGVNNFAIHKPGVRNYIHEWIFNEMMGDFGLIKPKYEFFELSINGTSNGLYAFEEKMGKEILERNRRKNGPIKGLRTCIFSAPIRPYPMDSPAASSVHAARLCAATPLTHSLPTWRRPTDRQAARPPQLDVGFLANRAS
jgi:hypothetical protein